MRTESFKKLVPLNKKLHKMINAGNGDTDEAEDLRCEMDSLWYQCTDNEHELIGKISECLFDLRKKDTRPNQ